MGGNNPYKFKVGDLVVLSAYGRGIKSQPSWLIKAMEQQGMIIGFITENKTYNKFPLRVRWFLKDSDRASRDGFHAVRELKSARYK